MGAHSVSVPRLAELSSWAIACSSPGFYLPAYRELGQEEVLDPVRCYHSMILFIESLYVVWVHQPPTLRGTREVVLG